jgi:hypothetical protein
VELALFGGSYLGTISLFFLLDRFKPPQPKSPLKD